MARRREQRLRAELPVRIFGIDVTGKPFSDQAKTLDISNSGARISGLQRELAIGDVIGVQRGTDKGRFRVAWISGKIGSDDAQIGVVSVQPGQSVWAAEISQRQPEGEYFARPDSSAAETLSGSERRKATRFPCNIGVEMQVENQDARLWAQCRDLGEGGCYIETRSPLPPNTHLTVTLRTESVVIRALCVVRTTHPHLGMGLQFIDMRDDDFAILSGVVRGLSRAGTLAQPLADRLKQLTRELNEVEQIFASAPVDGRALQNFREAIDSLRHTAWALENFMEMEPSSADASIFSTLLIRHRVRVATKVATGLATDLATPGLPPIDGLDELAHSIVALYHKLRALSPTALVTK